MASSTDRKIKTEKTEHIYLHDLLEGKTPEEAIEVFEQIRARFAEYSFLYRYDVKISMPRWCEVTVNVLRPETDAEYNKRQAKNKKARDTKLQRSAAEAKKKRDKDYAAYLKLKQQFEAEEK